MQSQLACYFAGNAYDSAAAVGVPGYPPMYSATHMTHVAPALTFVFVDQAPLCINDAFFALAPAGPTWSDVPASWHSRGCNFSFADGHAEYWHWTDPRMMNMVCGANTPNNPDMQRVQNDQGWR